MTQRTRKEDIQSAYTLRRKLTWKLAEMAELGPDSLTCGHRAEEEGVTRVGAV